LGGAVKTCFRRTIRLGWHFCSSLKTRLGRTIRTWLAFLPFFKDTLRPNHPVGLAFLQFFEDTLRPNHPDWLAFLQFFEDTLWPNHPVRFFSTLSLEKNAPSDSARSDVTVLERLHLSKLLMVSSRRNAFVDRHFVKHKCALLKN
jgi:hypothetical protein